MEYGRLEREIQIDASPEIVFEVISSPQHLRQWWPDDAQVEARPGAVGELVFGDRADLDAKVVAITVVDAVFPRLFSFRWVYPEDETATERNSLLVSFELAPDGDGTALRMIETGFRERGWDVAVLEAEYQEHVTGWDHYLPRLGDYVARLVPRR
ncbi:SRPBCC domain-containing protein [Jatrophihabitans telluris]|uniref:SRPBCC domain-containing protein n=1 Tax=Jatrophihabitans telluris TaxID=2038343 RepID=A0ABY4QUC1_9ACTN|nr:SRPBCC domain-containing protein [Jatrophihabitans telluris]UQX86676.1 SRPBCC domain-containing protein [Jatrophihabitans telluris]